MQLHLHMNQCADMPCSLASMVRGTGWQLSVQHWERLTHFLSVFSPSGRELIKEGLWFYLLSAPGPWVCVLVCVCMCVRAGLSLPYLRPFSVTPVQLGLAILPTFSQRHCDSGNADRYPLAKASLGRISTAMQGGAGHGSQRCGEKCNYSALNMIQISQIYQRCDVDIHCASERGITVEWVIWWSSLLHLLIIIQ